MEQVVDKLKSKTKKAFSAVMETKENYKVPNRKAAFIVAINRVTEAGIARGKAL